PPGSPPFPYTPLFRSQREHGAAPPVEVAREDVDDVDEPARQRPELDGARADAAVHRRARGGGERPGQLPDARRVDAAGTGHAGRSEEHTSELQSPDHL